MLKRIAILFILLAVSLPTHAALRFVRPGATGNASGSDWQNALPSLPQSLVRGDTYYLADGNYGNYTFDDNASGTALITIRKCTASDHGTETGYSATYCDGQASFGTMTFTRPYYVIDGATRNESNWKSATAYGISTSEVRASRLDGGHIGSDCSADNLVFKFMHVGTTTTSYPGTGGRSFYIGGFGSGSIACENWTIHRVLVQNTYELQCAGGDGLLVEYSYFYIGWSKEAIRGQVWCPRMTVRHNYFEDSCQRDPNDPTSGCTAEIAAWDGSSGAWDDIQVYGNVFFKTTSQVNSGGAVVIGGNGSSWVGSGANNSRVYNNTIAGLKGWNAAILINGGSGNECRNNLWYGNTGSTTGCTAAAASNNVVASSNPFVNFAGKDFRLSAPTTAGVPLPSPYNIDLRGTLRGAEGGWSVGAIQYLSGGALPPPLPAPTNVRLVP